MCGAVPMTSFWGVGAMFIEIAVVVFGSVAVLAGVVGSILATLHAILATIVACVVACSQYECEAGSEACAVCKEARAERVGGRVPTTEV